MEEKKELYWINYFRAICMIAIYYIHAQEFFEYSVSGLAKYILPVYVNGFFFVSGYLFFRKYLAFIENGTLKAGRKQFLLNMFFRLVIPSIIFSIIEYFPSNVLQHRDVSILTFIEKTIWGRTYWFISALVIAELLFCLLLGTKNKNILVYLAFGIVAFSLGCFIAEKEIYWFGIYSSNPWQFEKGLMAMLFLALGGVYGQYETKIDKWLHNPLCIMILVVFYITFTHFFYRKARVLISMNDINYVGVMISTVGIGCLVTLCKLIRHSSSISALLNKVGRNTIGFYFVCGAIPKVLMIVLPKILPIRNFPYMLIGFVLSFALAYVCVFVMNRYLPFLLDLRKGLNRSSII